MRLRRVAASAGIPGIPLVSGRILRRRVPFGSRPPSCVQDMEFAANDIFILGFVPLTAFARCAAPEPEAVRRAGGRAMARSGRRGARGGGRRKTQRAGRHVMVVESPVKARTIGSYLGREYRVIATRGHVRDLPAKAGSVRPEDGFAIVYETGRQAARTLAAVAKALERAQTLVLATDPDREGEAIAWQVLSWLAERGRHRRETRAPGRLPRSDAGGGAHGAGAAARYRHGPGAGLAGAPGARLPGRLRALADSLAQAAGLPLGRAGAVGGAQAALRPRGGDRGLRAAAILDGPCGTGGGGRRPVPGDAVPDRRDGDRRGGSRDRDNRGKRR